MKKTAYIIGISQPAQGLLTLYKHIASHIIYAYEKGYIPIVDCKHYDNQYFKDNKTYKDNSWEYFFQQPDDYNLDSLDEFDEIIISDNCDWVGDKYIIYPKSFIGGKEQNLSDYDKDYFKYLKFKLDLKEKFELAYNEKLQNKVTLGVLCRGTDYVKMRPEGHPVQPTAEEMIVKTKEILKKNPEIEQIYLATEDASVSQKFYECFGDLIVRNDQYLYKQEDVDILAYVKTNRENHSYNTGVEYLTSLYLLSKCKYFIAGKNNGTLGVYLLSNLFKNQEYVHIWEKGIYGKQFKYNNFFERLFSVKHDVFYRRSDKRNYSIKKEVKMITILGIKIKSTKEQQIER